MSMHDSWDVIWGHLEGYKLQLSIVLQVQSFSILLTYALVCENEGNQNV